ncbi:RHS repeat-associated core domain-containing protein [Pseudomonas helleri]|uniref:RHS repeat-associated core domain-containing protein n=1 Tax=Pseudomonas helleri TaxID=1608996 RepID=UPI0037F79668
MPAVLYTYDPLDRLIQTAGIRRFYNSSRMVTEIEGTAQRSVFQVGDHVLAEGGACGSNLLATDLQRSVLHTVNPNKPQSMAYNVYGHRPAESGVTSVLGFNGERADPVTGHYLLGNGYRAFNPVLMRFNSPDSWSPFGKGGINAYGYCSGDSINKSDPSGHVLDYLLRRFASVFGGRKLRKAISPSFHEDVGTKGGTKFTNVKQLSAGVFSAEKEVPGSLPQLVIAGHGSFDTVGGYIGNGGRKLRFRELTSLLEERGIKPRKYSSAHFMVCHSASGGEHALAFAFNKKYAIPTLGYEGRVVTMNDPMAVFMNSMTEVSSLFKRAQKIRTLTVTEGTDVIRNLSYLENPPEEIVKGFNYQPVWFQ